MTCVSGISYQVKSGDTLEIIAAREIGDPQRWSEIKKPDGTSFTEQEATQLQAGQELCLPSQLSQPDASIGFAAIVSREMYETIFPNRADLYSYDKLVAATQTYSHFCADGSDMQRKREAAAFLAHVAHETGELTHIEEQDQEAWTNYCDANNPIYPCVPGFTYQGRGPLQLSWNYNYGAAGQALGLDLLSNPDLVKTNGVIAFQTALWFWMTPQPPKPSIHDVITEIWHPSPIDVRHDRQPGFGMTINIINGEKECGNGRMNQANSRVNFYDRFTQLLGVDPGNNLFCDSMQPYDPT